MCEGLGCRLTFCAVSSPSAAPLGFLSLEKILENTLRIGPLMLAPMMLPDVDSSLWASPSCNALAAAATTGLHTGSVRHQV